LAADLRARPLNTDGADEQALSARVSRTVQLAQEGHEDAEAGVMYVQSSPLAMFWPYDGEAKLLGEDVYELDRPVT